MAAELKIGIGADNSGLKQGLQDAEAQISAFVSKVGKIGQIGEQLSSIGQKMSVGLTLPILALGGSAIKAYGDLQSLEMGLKAVMGSGAEATKELEKLREVAKLPGLGLKEAVKGSVSLQAAGFSANEARRSLMAFGNALATVGKGANELAFVNLALTQIQNKTGGFGQDLRQLTEQLPQLRGAMEAAFGTVDSEEVAKLGYTGKQVVKMLTDEFEKLPKVTGGIKNAFENLGDSIFINMSRIGKVIDDNFDISGIIDKLTGYLDTAISYFEGLSPAIQKTIIVVTGLVAAAGPLLIALGGIISALPTIITGVGALSTAFTVLTGPIGLVTVGILGIVTAVVANWGKIKPYLDETIDRFKRLYKESEIFRFSVVSVGSMLESVARLSSLALGTIWRNFKSVGKGILELWSGIGDTIEGALTLDISKIESGLKRGFGAINNAMFDTLRNNKDFITQGKGILNDSVSKWFALDVDKIKLPTFADSVADKVVTETKKGIDKANGKLKAEKGSQVELRDFEPILTKSKGYLNEFGQEFGNTMDFVLWGEQFRNGMKYVAIAATEGGESVINSVKSLGEQLNVRFTELLQSGLLDFGFAIGDALANGGNAIAAAGSSLLNTMSEFLMMFAKDLVKMAGISALYGKLLLAIKKASLNPIALIAIAGAAAIAAGVLAKSASNIGSRIGGGGYSGGGGSVPSGGGGGSQSYSSSFSSGGAGGGEVVFRISGNDLVGVLSRQQDKNTRIGG